MNSGIIEAVKLRAGDYCEVCGKAALASMAMHHRKLKSRGGKDSISNVIRIHHKCHNLGNKSIHMNPTDAESKGWMVSSWQEPCETPFKRPDGSMVLLNEDGTITEMER